MAGRKHTAEQIVSTLRQIEVSIGSGKTHTKARQNTLAISPVSALRKQVPTRSGVFAAKTVKKSPSEVPYKRN